MTFEKLLADNTGVYPLREPNKMKIKSRSGTYKVHFDATFEPLSTINPDKTHILISPHVFDQYLAVLPWQVAGSRSIVQISSAEENKALSQIPLYCEVLLNNGFKRNHKIICIGGGVTMDIASFVSQILFRGCDWEYWPTTLLSMADSCIGSKNSLQIGKYKNQVGTYYPPKNVYINPVFLSTLKQIDILNGWGEILKVHAIAGPKQFDWVAKILPAGESSLIKSALEIKKKLIEKDEFDQGPRLVLNYGHSFGHALETASDFTIPHGIAVMIGCACANHVSASLGLTTIYHTMRMNNVFCKYYMKFYDDISKICVSTLIDALRMDKKNRDEYMRLVMPDMKGIIKVMHIKDSKELSDAVTNFFESFM